MDPLEPREPERLQAEGEDPPWTDEPDGAEEVVADERVEAKPPRRFKVILHNDDYTTMDFVVDLLIRFFGKSHVEATHVMLMVHTKGAGVAGVYTREVAETKVAQVTRYARENGHPLLCTMEAE
ncbi:MAG: ATP-dependent Clp protease adapter ClpS [Myxococcota bacterium]